MKNILSHIILRPLILLVLSLAAVWNAGAFNTSFYREHSMLAEGRWVKVSVAETGMYRLAASQLASWGFKDPSKVRVYGYGGERLPDKLSADTYIDDLPQVPVMQVGSDIVFYGVGPVGVKATDDAHSLQSINPHTNLGYYYITEGDSQRLSPASHEASSGPSPATEFNEMVYHEVDLVNPGETGHNHIGESFIGQATRTFDFKLPGRVESTPVWMECVFYAKNPSSSRLAFDVNGVTLPTSSADNIPANNEHYTHAAVKRINKTVELTGTQARVALSHIRQQTGSLACLDYLTLNYTRRLAIDSEPLLFTLDASHGRLEGGDASTRLWDVTNPLKPIAINAVSVNGGLEWSRPGEGARRYVAWKEGHKLLSVGSRSQVVGNQDIHSRPVPHMVIFAHSQWLSQAERVAELHRRDKIDPLDVMVIDVESVYNEFSSGSPDPMALRKMLKMFWDRSSGDARLRYVMIMGRSTYDNRRILPSIAALNYPTLPMWQTDISNDDNTSFMSDDIMGMLADGTGLSPASHHMDIAVGRMPVTSLSDARNVVDKLEAYMTTPINTHWKNRVLMVADDENSGDFMKHSEGMIENALATPGASRVEWHKVYIDAYERQNGTYPAARNDMFRLLSEGVLWWNFAGHANPTSWTGDGLMTYTDINRLYLKHYPFVMAATCDFLRWDSKDVSAAEILYRTPSSGIIGAISATRPAFIDQNGLLMLSVGNHIFDLDDRGHNLTIGEIYRRMKNNSPGSGTWSNQNKLRYVLMGDPAMRLCLPGLNVSLDSINGIPSRLDLQPTMKASQDVRLQGRVTTTDGTPLDDFNGTLHVRLYDAEYSTVSHGYGNSGVEYPFEQQGRRLQEVVDSVKQGRFDFVLPMPSEVSHNFRPATMSLYAVAADGRDAVGVDRNFYVYGVDESGTPDTTAPVIESFYLNHQAFTSGASVNAAPVAIAHVRDNRSINLSSAGIGHQMLLSIDGRSLTDTPLYYTPSSDGTPGGTLAYQLDRLDPGRHELRLRVWDTSGNSASETIEFTVDPTQRPELHDLQADCNPASTSTRFLLTHDRPNTFVTVNIEVFNMMGQRVWSHTMNGMSEALTSLPVSWDLTDSAGRRLPHGIYLYRATVTDSDGLTSTSRSRRLAVIGG